MNFLRKAQAVDLLTLKVNNRTAILVDVRKFIAKYNLLNSVRTKIVDIKKGVQKFKKALSPLFSMGLPSFLDSENKLIPKSMYKESMIKTHFTQS